MPAVSYFEIAMSNGTADDADAYWMCIKGTSQPTVEEAQSFLAADSELIGQPVVGVYPIDEASARKFYDFDDEPNWPVFDRKAVQ